jgi:RNA 2',3'-cyclic 3'-phosphodiesterase
MILPQAERQRLFFALWPDPELAYTFHRLARAQLAACQGRVLVPEQIHLTLRYVGPVGPDMAGCLDNAASRLVMPSFSLIFDRLGYWPRPKVVWCMPSDIPSALLDLAARLDAACVACGLPADTRAYVPHLTLLRKARQAPPVPEMPATTWTVRDFALIHSETRSEGVVYTVLKRWALQ